MITSSACLQGTCTVIYLPNLCSDTACCRIQQLGGNVITDDGQEWKNGQQPEKKPEMRRLCFRPHSPASSNLLEVLKGLLPLSKEDIPLAQSANQGFKAKLSIISGDPTISTLEQTIIVATSIYIDFVLYHMSPRDIKWNSAANRQLVISTMQPRSKRDMVDNGIIYEWISAVNRTTFLVGFTDGDHEKQRVELIKKLEGVVKRLEGLDIG